MSVTLPPRTGGKVRVSSDLLVAGLASAALIAFSIVFGSTPNSVNNGDHRPPLHLAYFPNLTHAPAIVGVARGEFQRQVVGFKIEPLVVNAGPEAMEALLAGEVDIAYVGPSPAVNTYLKSGGKALKFLSGACSGGASLVSREGVDIRSVAELAGRRVAVPQLGGTQDVSLRHFMDRNHLLPKERGGTVEIIPAKNPDILGLFLQKQIDAAWVPEPWATRLRKDAHARTVIDERDLWPGGRFTTTVVVVRRAFADAHQEAVRAFLRAHLESVDWLNTHPNEGRKVVNLELKRLTGKALSKAVMDEAWNQLNFTVDANPTNILAMAEAARVAGYLKGIIDLRDAFSRDHPISGQLETTRNTR